MEVEKAGMREFSRPDVEYEKYTCDRAIRRDRWVKCSTTVMRREGKI